MPLFGRLNIIMGLIIFLCVILHMREYVCWYWKINQMTGELSAI